MDIDKTGSDDMFLGVDGSFGALGNVADFGNAVALHGDVGAIRQASAAIDDRSVLNHDIVSHEFLLVVDRLCPLSTMWQALFPPPTVRDPAWSVNDLMAGWNDRSC